MFFTQVLTAPILLAYLALAGFFTSKLKHFSGLKLGAEKMFWGAICKNAAFFFFAVLSALMMAQIIFNSFFTPISSWDTLQTWAGWSIDFLAYESSGAGFGSSWSHPRHPPTVYHLMAFNGFAFSESTLLQGLLLPWLFAWICGGVVVFGFVLAISNSTTLSMASTYLYTSLPLLENHGMLLGYIDLLVAVSVAGATAMLAFSVHYRSLKFALFGMVFSSALLLLKNTAVLYISSMWIPLAIIYLGYVSQRNLVLGIALALLIGVWILVVGFDFTFAGARYALVVGSPSLVSFGGWTHEVNGLLVLEALWSQFWAFFIEQSFSTLMLGGVVILWARGQASADEAMRFTRGGDFVIAAGVFMLVAFTLPQMFSHDYYQNYAAPGLDTGNSRFLMAVGPVFVMMLAFVSKPTSALNMSDSLRSRKAG
ncbi:hypothetical protein N9359_03405 [Luminiphilus sp.]|nr:hypothetical protein [Luminiphilus sp.]